MACCVLERASVARKAELSDDIRLVVADVDGTLLTPDKLLTQQARISVRRIIDAGIAFTITSGRPPQGLKWLIDDLDLRIPVTAFNGGLVVRPNLSVISEHLVTRTLAQSAIDILKENNLDVWLYAGDKWYITSPHRPHVAEERRAVKFPPTIVSTYDGLLDQVVKIVGVSDDASTMSHCVAQVQHTLGDFVSAALSQPYYLDITHPRANKGEVVDLLSALLAIPHAQIATIGDMPNDVLMFQRSGLSIAMGNATTDVQSAARVVTTSNTENGFALAMERYVLGAPTTRAWRGRDGR